MTEHDNGQIRMDVEGDQLALVPLPNEGIPASTGPELASPWLFPDTAGACFCPDDCNCHHPWRTNYCGCTGHRG